MATTRDKLLVEVGANTKPAERSFSDLQKSIDKFGGGVTAAFFKFNQAMQVAQTAVSGLHKVLDAAKFAAEFKQLESVVSKDVVGAIKRATAGTVTEIDAMRFAMKAMTGEFQLTTKGMEVVTAAAENLSDRGFGETMEIAEKLQHALEVGSTRALKEFGIVLDDTKDKTQMANMALEKLRQQAEVPVGDGNLADSLDRSMARLTDTINATKVSFGAMAAAFIADLEPVIKKAIEVADALSGRNPELAAKVAKRNKAISAAQRVIDQGLSAEEKAFLAGLRGDKNVTDAMADLNAQMGTRGLPTDAQLLAHFAKSFNDGGAPGLTLADRIRREVNPDNRLFVDNRSAGKAGSSGAVTKRTVTIEEEFSGLGAGSDMDNFQLGLTGGPMLNALGGAGGSLGHASLTEIQDAAKPGHKSSLPGLLESDKFYKDIQPLKEGLTEIEKQMVLASDAYALFETAAVSAVDAAISGQMSIGKAIQAALKSELRSMAIRNTVKAAEQVAMGLAAAANPLTAGSAGGHFAAAAKFAAVAALAGGASAAVPGAGMASDPRAGTGAGRPVSGGFVSPRTGDGGTTIIVNVGEGYVGEPKKIGQAIQDRINTARRAGYSSSGVVRYV